MKLNGNLTLNEGGASEIQNAIIERVASNPSIVAGEKGRIVFNSTDSLYYYNNGSLWQPFATGGNAASLQTEVDAIETSLGSMVNGDGTFVAGAFSGFNKVTTPTSVLNALSQLDAAITGKDQLSELSDVTLTSPASGQYLRYTGTAWVNDAIQLADLDGLTVTAAELNQLASAGATNADFVKLVAVTASAAELNILDGATLTTTELNFVDGVTSSIQDQLDALQPGDATLTGLAALADVSAVTDQIIFTSNGTDFTYQAGAAARQRLGLAIGTDVQAFDADLVQIAGFTPAVNDFIVCTGTTEGSRYSVAGGATLRTALGLGNIATQDQSLFIKTDGTSTITANITMSGQKIINLGSPTGALDAVNKTYVDNLVTSGAKWVNPVRNPDLVGIADDLPTTPLASGLYIAYGGTYPQTWGSITDVSSMDMMHYTASGWQRSGVLGAGTRLLAGVFTNAIDADAGETLAGTGILENDLVEYVGGADPTDPANWSFPNGRVGSFTISGVSASSSGNVFTVPGDATKTIYAGNEVVYTPTAGSASTYTVASVTFSTPNTLVVVNETLATAASGVLAPEMRDGTTTLTNNSADSHFGQTYLYVTGSNEWVQIAGPGSVDAGIGLGYAGTTLNVLLGAGINEGPTDEVGIDLYDTSTGALILTTDGSARSGVTGAKLHLKTNLTQFDQDAGGLFLKAGGVTGTELNASVAGAGLTGGAGNALAVVSATGTGATGGDTPADWTGVGTVTVTADAVGVTLGNTSITAAPGNHSHKAAAISFDNTAAALGVDVDTVQEAIDALDVRLDGVIAGSGSTITSLQTEVDAIEAAVGLAADGTFAAFSGTNYVDASTTIKGAVTLLDTALKTEETARINLATKLGASYFLYTGASSTTHTVTHSIGQKFCNVTVVDSSDEVIIPQSIKFDSASQLTVTFNAAIACKVICMGVS